MNSKIKNCWQTLKARKIIALLPFWLSLIFFSFFIIYRSGSISYTFDEGTDNKIVTCYTETKNPFACDDDISQTRFPFYLHAAARLILSSLPPAAVDHGISFIFALAGFILIYWFSHKEFNRAIANLTAVGMATSIPLIASGRMILTHSSVIFSFFSAAAIITFYYFLKKEKNGYLILTACFYGLTVASSLVGVMLFPFFIIFYLLADCLGKISRNWLKDLILLGIVSVLTFFVFSLIHGQPAELKGLFHETQIIRTYFNYFSSGSYTSPWYFSLLIFIVKFSPLPALLFFCSIFYVSKQIRQENSSRNHFLLSLYLFILTYFFLKSAGFNYDAPHHQLFFYCFAYLLAAYAIYYLFQESKKYWRKYLIGVIIFLAIGWQVYWLIFFFPNLMFYGAQYGERFIGEIYGPAVTLCQDFGSTEKAVTEITEQGKNVLPLNYLCFIHSTLADNPLIPAKGQIGDKNYEYVYTDFLVQNHYQLPPEIKAYSRYLETNCQKYFSHRFPTGEEIYFIYRCPVTK